MRIIFEQIFSILLQGISRKEVHHHCTKMIKCVRTSDDIASLYTKSRSYVSEIKITPWKFIKESQKIAQKSTERVKKSTNEMDLDGGYHAETNTYEFTFCPNIYFIC